MKTERSSARATSRDRVLARLAAVGREHSDATVLFHSTIADRMNLHPTDYKVLGMLDRLGPLTAGDIARASGLATASVTNLIDRLEQKGFARRTRDHQDRRRVVVEPVADADRVAGSARVFASTRQSLAQLYARYSVRDLTVIADFLEKNAERLRAETAAVAAASSTSR